ncbi:DUF4242 domain-containing protein [Leucobacter sp. GX24907]
MALFLVEAEIAEPGREAAAAAIEAISSAYASSGGSLVEAQVPASHSRVYLILDGDECAGVALDAAEVPGVSTLSDAVPVRIVGATVDEVRARGAAAGYLVEWDIPEEITMEQYLEAKKRKSPLYDTVDDVDFLRTYVREDTQKCLCFYDAETEQAVRHAREVVSTPVSRLHQLDGTAAIS